MNETWQGEVMFCSRGNNHRVKSLCLFALCTSVEALDPTRQNEFRKRESVCVSAFLCERGLLSVSTAYACNVRGARLQSRC